MPISTIILRVIDRRMHLTPCCEKCASENFQPDHIEADHGLLRLPIPEDFTILTR